MIICCTKLPLYDRQRIFGLNRYRKIEKKKKHKNENVVECVSLVRWI